MRRDSIDRFRLIKQLGSGAFGVVWEAYDEYRNRTVALKILAHIKPDSLYRFKQEFRILSELRHRNLVSLYELLAVGEMWMFSMEIVHGADLLEHLAMSEIQQALLWQQMPTIETASELEDIEIVADQPRLAVTPLYSAQVRETFRQLATGIAVLHAKDIIHRDIKPANVLITIEGRVVLLDFGLVVELSADSFDDPAQIIGSPGYMSPEQMMGRSPAAASDWYSVGVVLFQALTGTLPFGGNVLDIIRRQQTTVAPLASSIVAGIPEDLDVLCRDLLRRDPDDRPGEREILLRFGVPEFGGRLDERTRKRASFLFGRDREIAKLQEMAQSNSGPRSSLVHGSPGIGKTAVLDFFLHGVRDSEEAVLLGSRCYERESVPFKTIDGLVDSLTRYLKRQSSEIVHELVPPCAVNLARIFPVLGTIDHIRRLERQASETDPSLDDASSALGQILSAIAQRHLLIVVLEDIQWGDYASALMMNRALRELDESCNYFSVSCHRTEDAPTSLFLQTFSPPFAMEALPICELREEESAGLAERLLTDIPDHHSLIAPLVAAAKGNPLLMEMLVDNIHASMRPLSCAPRLLDTLADLLAGQSVAARRLFEVVLVADAPIESQAALRAAGIFEGDEPLRALSRARLVRSRWTGNLEELMIFHPLIYSTLRPTIDPTAVAAIRSDSEAALRE